MKTNIVILLTIIIIIGLSFNAYSQKRSKEKGKSEVIVPATFEEVSFVQLIQPAFASDFANKGVIFEATFFAIMNMTMDLPDEYKGFIRLQLCSSSSPTEIAGVATNTCENMYYNVVISKEKSTPIFSLKQGQKIKFKAVAINNEVISGITGGTQSSLLLIIDSIEIVQ